MAAKASVGEKDAAGFLEIWFPPEQVLIWKIFQTGGRMERTRPGLACSNLSLGRRGAEELSTGRSFSRPRLCCYQAARAHARTHAHAYVLALLKRVKQHGFFEKIHTRHSGACVSRARHSRRRAQALYKEQEHLK